MDKVIQAWLPFIYLFLISCHAYNHAYLIEKKNILLKSTRKGIEFGIIVLVAFFAFRSFSPIMPLLVLPVFIRAAFYDTLLNWFRGKDWLYEGEIKRKKGFFDWLENLIGLPTFVYRIAYAMTLASYLTFYYLKIF